MNRGKIFSGIAALVIYMLLILTILFFYNIHQVKAKNYVEKNENRVTVTLVNSEKTVLNRSDKSSNTNKPTPLVVPPIPLKIPKKTSKEAPKKDERASKPIPKKIIAPKVIPKKIVKAKPKKRVIATKKIPKKAVLKKVVKKRPKKVVKKVPKKKIPKKVVKKVPKKKVPKKSAKELFSGVKTKIQKNDLVKIDQKVQVREQSDQVVLLNIVLL